MAGIQSDSQPNGEYEYGKEGAHSRRRILHVGDATGQAITNGLVAAFKMYPNINILTNTTAVDLITFPHHSSNPLEAKKSIVSNGVYAFDSWERIINWYISAATALVTGGLGRRYRNTSNPPVPPATAWRWHTAQGRGSSVRNISSSTLLLWHSPAYQRSRAG
jgi:L-aspartate oxidase